MSVNVNLTEQEILEHPNDFDLGGYARQKYWTSKEEFELRAYDDERFVIVADENGLVTGIHLPKNLPVVDDFTDNGYDKCVRCGKVSPYKTTTHIDLRIGYVEGAGQGCFQPTTCSQETKVF